MFNKINILAFIKNEEKLIDHFLSYHQNIADNIYVINHDSTDNTLNIISKYKTIKLIHYYGDFNKKGDICSYIIKNMDADIVIPLDADERIIYDDGFVISDNSNLIRSYLQNIPISACLYKIANVYDQLNDYMYHKNGSIIKFPKLILPIKHTSMIECGFHNAVLNNTETPIFRTINISYVHYHYRCKKYWLDSCKKKLKARLQDLSEDPAAIQKLADSKNKSFHVAQEYLNYLNNGNFHNFIADTHLILPSLTGVMSEEN